MSNEYDYSGLYNNTSGSGQPNGQNPQPEQSAPAQNQQPQQSSYPNVGSSGVNTASRQEQKEIGRASCRERV